MYFTRNDIKKFTEENGEGYLRMFLEKRKRENVNLEYKSALNSDIKERKKEFLKDVTGFANAYGADIFIGVIEPSDDLTVEEQLCGIDDGKKIATELERIVSGCVKPRITGLEIISLCLAKGKDIIIVHIPPSSTRPHMIERDGHQYFYIRHSESTQPMSIQEIRDSVLSSVTSEARAKEYLKEMEGEFNDYVLKEKKPCFFIQAMPIMGSDLFQHELNNSIQFILCDRNKNRWKKYGEFSLANEVSLCNPSLYGIKNKAEYKVGKWESEIHRNGYIGAYQFNEKKSNKDGNTIITENVCSLFKSFCELCADLFSEPGWDLPYIFRCKYFNAKISVFYISNLDKMTINEEWSQAFGRDIMRFDDRIRQVGDDTSGIAKMWCDQLHNAFGKQKPI